MPAYVQPALIAVLSVLTLAALAFTGRLRLLREEFPNRFRFALGLGLFLAIVAIVVWGPTVSPGEAADVDTATMWFPELFTGHLFIAIFLQCWWMLAWPMPLARFLRLEGAHSQDVMLGVFVGFVGWVLALVASSAVTGVLYLVGWMPASDAVGGDLLQIPPLILWLSDLPITYKLVVIAVAMTVEEAFYRGFLQPRIGWIPSSVLFALSHAGYGMPNLLASVLMISLAIGWAFRRSGNLLPCIVAHGFFDAVQLLVIMPLAINELRQLAPG